MLLLAASSHIEAAAAVAAGEREPAYRSRGFDSRQSPELLDDLLVETALSRSVSRRRQANVENEEMIRMKSRIHLC